MDSVNISNEDGRKDFKNIYRKWLLRNPRMNSSDMTTEHEKISESIYPPALQFAFGVVGNIIALGILLKKSKEHKWKPFYRLVGGLAITDFCGIALVYPAVMIRYGSGFTFEYPKELCEYVSFIWSFSFMSSAMIVAVMSFDRFYAIMFPMKYITRDRGCATNIALVIIWTTSGGICSLHVLGIGSVKSFYPGSWCFMNFVSNARLDRISCIIYFVFGMVVLGTTSTLNFTVIFHLCRKSFLSTKNAILVRNMKQRRRKSDICVIAMLLAIVIVFTVCWVPLMVSIIYFKI